MPRSKPCSSACRSLRGTPRWVESARAPPLVSRLSRLSAQLFLFLSQSLPPSPPLAPSPATLLPPRAFCPPQIGAAQYEQHAALHTLLKLAAPEQGSDEFGLHLIASAGDDDDDPLGSDAALVEETGF